MDVEMAYLCIFGCYNPACLLNSLDSSLPRTEELDYCTCVFDPVFHRRTSPCTSPSFPMRPNFRQLKI